MSVSIESHPMRRRVSILVPLVEAVVHPVVVDEPFHLEILVNVELKVLITWERVPLRMISKMFSGMSSDASSWDPASSQLSQPLEKKRESNFRFFFFLFSSDPCFYVPLPVSPSVSHGLLLLPHPRQTLSVIVMERVWLSLTTVYQPGLVQVWSLTVLPPALVWGFVPSQKDLVAILIASHHGPAWQRWATKSAPYLRTTPDFQSVWPSHSRSCVLSGGWGSRRGCLLLWSCAVLLLLVVALGTRGRRQGGKAFWSIRLSTESHNHSPTNYAIWVSV